MDCHESWPNAGETNSAFQIPTNARNKTPNPDEGQKEIAGMYSWGKTREQGCRSLSHFIPWSSRGMWDLRQIKRTTLERWQGQKQQHWDTAAAPCSTPLYSDSFNGKETHIKVLNDNRWCHRGHAASVSRGFPSMLSTDRVQLCYLPVQHEASSSAAAKLQTHHSALTRSLESWTGPLFISATC